MTTVFACLLCLLSVPAHAGHVEASLLSARASALPGERFEAGLKLKLKDGWHVYWSNPGDAGLAPDLAWRLPPGWTAAPMQWPAPVRLEMPPLTNFGYNDEVVLPLTLAVSPGARPGTRASLSAKAQWLECRETCQPASADLALSVGVSEKPRDRAADAAAIAGALADVPRADPRTTVKAVRGGNKIQLRLKGRHPLAEFFPAQPYVFTNARSAVSVSPLETEITLDPVLGAALPERVEGVLLRPGLPPEQLSIPVTGGGAVWHFLLFAFAGGLLLNLMPCVLPVLTIKALGLLKHAQHPGRARHEALAYTAGVVLSCVALAAALLAARRAGQSLGWGTQMQSPWLVAALAALFIAAGLSLLGVFEVGARWIGIGSGLSAREGRLGAFFSGMFTMAAGAPCTAPFMGATLGWAIARPAGEVLAVFGALGLGAAAPYAGLSSWPALHRLLPRPGNWMVVLKKVLSVPMFATSLWLLWVLLQLTTARPPAQDALWRPWSQQAVAQARAAGQTVVVDFTAAWCLSCQVNERTALAAPAVRAALTRPGVAAFRADWTGRDAGIAAELAKYGRNGVPLYVVHPGGGPAVLLPELLTPGLLLDTLATPTTTKGKHTP
ncbi:MAG TPA: protein-disulfide reductase DsbD family protein [Elusimicrobiales bacterium]|nr:protein-disulfide reductase DsbD family protein [Elusimicrobiales bacterium]